MPHSLHSWEWTLSEPDPDRKLAQPLALTPTLTRTQRAKPLVTAPTVRSKSCSRCLEVKPASEFNINKTTSSGLTSHCKVRQRPLSEVLHAHAYPP